MRIVYDTTTGDLKAVVGIFEAYDNLDSIAMTGDTPPSPLTRYQVVKGKLVNKHPELTDEQVDELYRPVAEVSTAPVVKAPITKLAFMDRFTMEELAGIYTAAKTEVMIEVFLDKLKLATEINLSDANTIVGVNALATAGLLTTDRAAEILA
jgi:hypothetical protein